MKGVRETMNQMIEAWNAILDVPEEVSPQPESHSGMKVSHVCNCKVEIHYCRTIDIWLYS